MGLSVWSRSEVIKDFGDWLLLGAWEPIELERPLNGDFPMLVDLCLCILCCKLVEAMYFWEVSGTRSRHVERIAV